MLEACDCVEFVCDAGNGEALMQLAEFLFAVEEEEAESLTGADARDGEGAARVMETNPRGRLLERDQGATWAYSQDGLRWLATVTTNGPEAS